MYRMNRLNALYFDDNRAFDDQIDAVAQLDFFSIVNNG